MNRANNTDVSPRSVNQQRSRFAGEPPDTAQALAAETAQRQPLPQPNQFGMFKK